MKGTASKSENKITAIMAIFIMILVFIAFKNGSFQPKEGTVNPITQVTVDKSVVPGSCLVLEEKYCRMVKSIDGFTDAMFKLPVGVPIFSPYTGTITFFLNGQRGLLVSKGMHKDDWYKADAIVIFYTGLSEDGIKNGDQVSKGDILARTGETNLHLDNSFNKYNLLMYFTKDGPNTLDNVQNKKVFGIS